MKTFRARMSSLSLGQSSGSFPAILFTFPPAGLSDSFPLPEQAPPSPLPPYLSSNNLITSKCACLPQREESGEGPTLERRALSPSRWQPGSRPAHPLGSAFVPPSFHSPPPTISSLLSHSLPSDPWVLNYNWDPGNAFLSTIFMGWADTFN